MAENIFDWLAILSNGNKRTGYGYADKFSINQNEDCEEDCEEEYHAENVRYDYDYD